MDIRNILNTDSDTSKSAVHRSASLAQPPPHPPLPRQTSMPNFPPEYRQSDSPPAPTPTQQSPPPNSYYRDRSLSVSPKTKVTSLIAPHVTAGYEYEVYQNPTPVSNNGNSIEAPHYPHPPPIHTSPMPTMMAPPAYNSSSPIQTVRPPQPVPTHPYAALQTPPAPTHSYQSHAQQIDHSPVSYTHSTHSGQNSISHQRRGSHISAMTESPVAGSRKRSLESATSEASQQPPAPKRRKYETPPIWAQRFDRSKEKPYTGPKPSMPRLSHLAPTASTQRSITPVEIKSEPKNEQKVNGHPTTPPAGPDRSWQQEAVEGWEPSFDNMVPYNDVVMQVADRIFDNILNCPFKLPKGSKWEIEAKLGHLIDKSTGERLNLPVRTETILDPVFAAQRVRFDSKMSMAQHKALNKYLNLETTKSQSRKEKIRYKHTVEIDKFYDVPEAIMQQLPEEVQKCRFRRPQFTPRVRVATDARTGEVKEKIIKFRIEDVEILCPRLPNQCDYRISISVEYRYPFEVDNLIEVKEDGRSQNRRKDRMSYAHQCMHLDLTQVKTEAGEPSHEMEVELSPERVIEEGMKSGNNEENRFEALVGTFLNYVRSLSRAEVGVAS